MSVNITQTMVQIISMLTSMLPLVIQLMILALVLRLLVLAFKPVTTKEAVKKEEKTEATKGGS